MQVCAEDEYFEYFEAKVESSYNRICYYFKLVKGQEWIYYYADRFTQSLPEFYVDGKLVDGRSEYYQYPFILREEIPDVPNWFKTAVVYNIFPDSFASGKRFLCKERRYSIWRMEGYAVGGLEEPSKGSPKILIIYRKWDLHVFT